MLRTIARPLCLAGPAAHTVLCGALHGLCAACRNNLSAVSTKYYTHFVTSAVTARTAAGSNEWSGVVELRQPLTHTSASKELRSLLAQSFDLDSEEIRILHWARLH